MFYQSIAEVYDYIFPQNRKQLEFIESISTIAKEESILDVGCATGNLSELLAERSDNVTGIDLDNDLLSIAKNKEKTGNIVYKKANMLYLREDFENTSFDKIISFGNTLVHLPSRESVVEYFRIVYDLLKSNGSFIVQIINYDRIINKNIDNLPTIDNEEIKFVRNYNYNEDIGNVDFITELYLKKDNKVIKNSIPLLALTKSEINKILIDTGFQNVKFYGGLDGQELTGNSVPLLFSCRK
ncbi:MAG: class I SAM-dependent methyltransferase [Candidatus Delongbacteria bacterium]|nr:class I SAM-dependent methyltransferase [Candidatus Delongbacteria bacterium]